jgi:3-oxoacyl-(acyl-carrier-protein) synthase
MGEGTPDAEAAVDLVIGEGRKLARGGCAVSTSFAFGGANAALVLADWPAELER